MDRRAFFAAGLGASAAISAGVMLAQNSSPTNDGVSRALAPPDLPIDPRRTAFINVDMQNRFVEGYPESAPGGPALLRRINAFAVVCRGAGLRVIHTAHVLRP
ncbi:MAG TPA: isochorismatase family protein [Vicinamibacterales bacterium]|nr:isochorismatase family protein [Vicinamibacterales bacterium]